MRIHAACWRSGLRSVLRPPVNHQLRYFSYNELPGKLQIPQLSGDDSLMVNNGIKGLYSPTGFKYAYTDFQGWCLTELNERINQVNLSSSSDEGILRDVIHAWPKMGPQGPGIFNFASMAFNNHFYMKNIQNTSVPMSSDLQYALDRDFGSVDNFKTEFLANAKAMFGPGFVWLVRDSEKKRFFIYRTYSSGSPLQGAQFRQQKAKAHFLLDEAEEKTAERILHRSSLVLDVEPVLCVSTWQHSYIVDYGVGGKVHFLNRWWDRVDWDQVAAEVRRVEEAPQIMFQGSSNRPGRVASY